MDLGPGGRRAVLALTRGKRPGTGLAGRVAEGIRSGVAWSWRRLPPSLDARHRLLGRINRACLQAGADPVAVARMRSGHRLILDLRSGTEWLPYFSGRFDAEQVCAACRLLDRGDIALDVGANIGLWTIALGQRAREVGGHVHAFEPVPANADRLAENVHLNDLRPWVTIHPVAASDRSRQLELTLREDFAEGGATGNAAVRIDDGTDDDFDTVSARARPIDDVLGAPDGPVSVIKIDVEGHEDLALRGAAQLVERCRPTVFIEWNPIYYERRGVEPTTLIDALLDRWGYRCLRRVDGRWTEQPSFWSPYDLDNLVLCPADRIDEILGRLQAAASGMAGVTG